MDNDSAPLYPQVYPQVKMQKMDNTEAVPLTPPPPPVPAPIPLGARVKLELTPLGVWEQTIRTLERVALRMLMGPDNTVTVCSFCRASIKTSVRHTVTSRTHLISALWCIMCCCCCIPYCMESTKNSDHYCPSCNKYLGTYRK